MRRRLLVIVASAIGVLASLAAVQGQEIVKIGLILPMTGPFTSTGRQIEAAARLYMQQNGDTVAGKKVQLILRDDTGVADVTRRIAQELIVNDKVDRHGRVRAHAAGLGDGAPVNAGEGAAGHHGCRDLNDSRRLAFHRSLDLHLPQATIPMAEWAAQNGIKKVLTIVSDYGPGIDAEKAFSGTFAKAGGQVDNLRVPLANPDFSPFLQRAADAKPDAIFVFVPSGVGAQVMKQFVERGLDKSGIKLIGTGDVTDDDILNGMGDAALGTITAHHYSAAHDSPENKAFVDAFKKTTGGIRPNFMAVGGYDGMHLIYEGLKKTNGAGGEALVNAMKGMSWTSPRGPVTIDPQHAGHHPEHLHAQGRAGRRRALQCGVRDDPEREGSRQG